MERVLGRYSSYIYAILRIVVGFSFMLHGTQKLFGWPPWPPTGGGGPAIRPALIGSIPAYTPGM